MREDYMIDGISEREPNMATTANELNELRDEVTSGITDEDKYEGSTTNNE